MEIVAARIDGPTGRQMCGAGKRQTHDPAGRVSAVCGRPASKAKASDARHFVVMSGGGYERLLTIRGIFAKKNQKAPESVRASGIALRRLWALRLYNR